MRYVLGMARNKKLRALIDTPMEQARTAFVATGEGGAGVYYNYQSR